MFTYIFSCFFFFKQKTAYEMRISDWSSDVCSSDLTLGIAERTPDQVKRLETFRSRPFWYKCNRFAFVGPDVTVQWPAYSSWMDFELELGLVIGRGGRNISVERASDHIFGLNIFNAFSARDTHIAAMAILGPGRSTDFAGTHVRGPSI